jgi:hypothetical protein
MGRLAMRRTFERSATGAGAPLAVLLTICLIGPVEAGGLASSTEGATALPVSRCGPGEGCPRIRGHIPAASEIAGVDTIGGRPATLGPPPPFLAGLGAAGQAADDALNRLFFLQASHDDTAR